jgi:hypothetical protein
MKNDKIMILILFVDINLATRNQCFKKEGQEYYLGDVSTSTMV